MKKKITLNESTLYRLISESVKNVLREAYELPSGPEEIDRDNDMYVMVLNIDYDDFYCEPKPYKDAFEDMKEEYEEALQIAKKNNRNIKDCHIDKLRAEIIFDDRSQNRYWDLIPENDVYEEEYGGDPENDPEAYYNWERKEKAYQDQAAQEAQWRHPQTVPFAKHNPHGKHPLASFDTSSYTRGGKELAKYNGDEYKANYFPKQK